MAGYPKLSEYPVVQVTLIPNGEDTKPYIVYGGTHPKVHGGVAVAVVMLTPFAFMFETNKLELNDTVFVSEDVVAVFDSKISQGTDVVLARAFL